MADELNVYKKCLACNGTGIIVTNDETYDSGPPVEVPCPTCNGEGEIFWGRMVEEEVE